MGIEYEFESHANDYNGEVKRKVKIALEEIGIIAEKYAKAMCPVGTPESTGIRGYFGGTLRNSITHEVVMDEKAVYIGSDVEYAPYQELGYHLVNGVWHPATNSGKGYLRPAIEDHLERYDKIIKSVMKQ